MAPITACFALGVAFTCAGTSNAATEEGQTNQARIAESTGRLEKAFAEQFVKGTIDREALAGPISDVVQSMPETTRPKVQQHIESILTDAAKLVTQLTPEQRSQAVAATAKDKVGQLEWGMVGAWGWPGAYGFGGLGAFGFPGMYAGFGLPYAGLGFGGCGGLGFGCAGLGLGGWYW
jgi:hypothetical protein